MVILVFFLVISVNRRLFRYFGSYSGISVIPVILVNRRTVLPTLFGRGMKPTTRTRTRAQNPLPEFFEVVVAVQTTIYSSLFEL